MDQRRRQRELKRVSSSIVPSSNIPSSNNAASPLPSLLKRFWRDFVWRRRSIVVLAATLMILSVLLQLPVPLLTLRIIDAVVADQSLSIVNQLALALMALVILRHVFSYIHEKVTLQLKESIILDIQDRLYRQLQTLPLSFFSQKHSTYLQSRVSCFGTACIRSLWERCLLDSWLASCRF